MLSGIPYEFFSFLELHKPRIRSITDSQEIFDGAIRVVEGCTHGSFDLALLEAHGLHIGNGFSALSAHGQARRRASCALRSCIGGSLRGRCSLDIRGRRG